MVKTYVEVLTRASSFLEEAGKEGHAIEYLFLNRKNWDKTTWLLKMREAISQSDEALIIQDMAALLKDIPPQYLLGYEEFFGQRFKVTEDTLIPRPETEELVALCLEKNPTENLKVTDIGTGTGAIAISLKLARPTWQLTAVDISEKTLAVAQENATTLKAEIDFLISDVLAQVTEPQDIIISNPPYISGDEWHLMDPSVRLFEPKQALFAAENGLAIYQKIAREAPAKLKPEGQLFLEIGFQQAAAVQEIFREAFPEKKISVIQDLSGNDRMVWLREAV